jgi:multimeric flavodoxin WrbA
MKKGIILLGSSNSVGNTYKAANYIQQKTGFPIVDLKTKNIGQFDYEFKNKEDDFLPLMKDIVENYDLIIFASPIYWYSMSGIMKKFFDRISDCLYDNGNKEIGRKLRGKQMAVLSSSSGSEKIASFYIPFIESAKYLGMNYLGDVHTWVVEDSFSKEVLNPLDTFCASIN